MRILGQGRDEPVWMLAKGSHTSVYLKPFVWIGKSVH
jgi:hypothetical protein